MFAEIHKELYSVLPFVLTTVGISPNQPFVWRPCGLRAHEFIWVTKGEGNFYMGDEQFQLTAGEGVFIRAGVGHRYEGKNFDTAWCTFSMREETLNYLGVGDYLRFPVPAYLERETEQLLRFANGESTVLSRSSAGYAYVMELFSTILAPADTVSVRVLRLLEQRYSEPLTLDDIAAEVRMDRFALCRVYKRERGVTVMEDLNRIRIAKAKRFLKYSAYPIETVGRMCGFESPSYFGKRFREAVGSTPADYRKDLGEKK